MRSLTMLFYLLLGAALAIFVYSNFEERVVIYFTHTYRTGDIPLSLALFGAMLAGFLVSAVLAVADQLRLRGRLRKLRKTNERLESELAALRNLPLTSLPTSERRPDSEKDSPYEPERRAVD
jgi:uncharacterized integral membrane protein